MSLTDRMKQTRAEKSLQRYQLDPTGLPKKYWAASLDRIPDELPYKSAVCRYVEHLDELVTQGRGLLLWGPNRKGKTAIGAIVLKEAVRRGYDSHFVRAADYVDGVFQRMMVDEEMSLAEAVRDTKLLILDDLGKEIAGKSGATEGMIDNLLRARESENKATIVTTNIALPDLPSVFRESMVALMRGSMYPLEIDGMDYSKEEQSWLEGKLNGP